MKQTRKDFLAQAGGSFLLSTFTGSVIDNRESVTQIDRQDFPENIPADDERAWKRIAKKYYRVSGRYINLENGYFGVQPKPVLESYLQNVIRVNEELSGFARKEYPAVFLDTKKQLAAFLQVAEEEIVITRNATEALNIAIQGYPFSPGDEVIISQLDYFSMIETFRMMEKRGRLTVKAIDLPLLPGSEEEIVEVYRKAITPKTRVILLTHVSNITGLIIPVRKISMMAREAGVDTITDSAHALGQIPFSLPELGSDFVGMNLHKWIGNPVGAGVLYIRKDRIAGMRKLWGDDTKEETDINKLAHFGTTPFAVIMTIPQSLLFHQMLGIENISNRLQYLKAIWTKAMERVPGAELVTPVAGNLSCAIASFRIRDKKNSEVIDYLYSRHNILTVNRVFGPEECIRVTPSLYTRAEDIQKFIEVMRLED